MVVPAKRGISFSSTNNTNKNNKSDHVFHEPTPSNLPSNGQRFGNKVRCKSFFAMATAPERKRSLDLLRRLLSLVKPIMAKHNFTIGSLHEFYPKDAHLLGMNMNKGFKIFIRLRYAHDPNQYLDEESLIETMLHELTHNLYGPHDKTFFDFLNKISDELNTFRFLGKWDGEGFLSEGRKLGGRRIPTGGDSTHDDKVARLKALEGRLKLQSLGLGSNRTGRTLNEGGDVNQVLARGLSGKKAGGKSEADRRAEAISKRMGLLPKSNHSPSNPSQHAQTCPSSAQHQKEAEKELKEVERLHGIVVITIDDDDEDQDGQDEEEMLKSMGRIEEMEKRIKSEDGDWNAIGDGDDDSANREEEREIDKSRSKGKGKEKEKEKEKEKGKQRQVEIINLDSSDEEQIEGSKKTPYPNLDSTTKAQTNPNSTGGNKKRRIQEKDQGGSTTDSDSDIIVIDPKGSNEKNQAADHDSDDSFTEDEDEVSTKTSSKKKATGLTKQKSTKIAASNSLSDKSNTTSKSGLNPKVPTASSNTSQRSSKNASSNLQKPIARPIPTSSSQSKSRSKESKVSSSNSRLLNPPKDQRSPNPNLSSNKAMKELEKQRKESTAEKIWKLKQEAEKREREDQEKAFKKALGLGETTQKNFENGKSFTTGFGIQNTTLGDSSSSTPSSSKNNSNPSFHSNHSSNFSTGDYLSDSLFDRDFQSSSSILGSTSSRSMTSSNPSSTEPHNPPRGKLMNRMGGPQWPCQNCTLFNNSENVVCEACECTRPGISVGDLVMAGVSGVNTNSGLGFNGGIGNGNGNGNPSSSASGSCDTSSSNSISFKGKGKARERDVDLLANGWQCFNCSHIMKDAAAAFWSCSKCGQIKGSS